LPANLWPDSLKGFWKIIIFVPVMIIHTVDPESVDNDDFVRVGQTFVELDPAVYKTALSEGIV
jgi:hypothetical protein